MPDTSDAIRTLQETKASLERWHGHMRRGAQLQSEAEYALALTLVPGLPAPKPFLVRTLRGLADLYAGSGKLEEAGALFARLSAEASHHSLRFQRDYLGLMFRLAERRLTSGDAAGANLAMEDAGRLLAHSDEAEDLAPIAGQGYALAAESFERVRQSLPAQLYARRSAERSIEAGLPEEAEALYRRLAAMAYQRRDPGRALTWLEEWMSAQPPVKGQAAGVAQSLAQSAAAGGRAREAQAYFARAEAWLGPDCGEPALADLYLAWAFWLPPDQGVAKARVAVEIRERFLGAQHAKTLEALRALQNLESGSFGSLNAGPSEVSAPQPWQGGAVFGSAAAPASGELRRLHRRLAALAHPDLARDADDAGRRHEAMLKINSAADRGDLFQLRSILREWLAGLAAGRQG